MNGFDGDGAVNARIARLIHRAHGASSQLRGDLIAAQCLFLHGVSERLLRIWRSPGVKLYASECPPDCCCGLLW